MTKKFVVWFRDVGKEDIAIVGGKGANLGEMTRAGFPVPSGFIVTAHAYYTFLERSKIKDKIYNLLSDLDVGDSSALAKASGSVCKLICRTPFPRDIAAEIIQAYFKLERGIFKNPLVAVRSSATAEDLPTASFAGQQATFLNVAGEANVIEKVREAWASLFTARAIFYRATNKFNHFKVGIAVPVQRMVSSDSSGIMFTVDPVTNDKSKIIIEAIYGLGEMIVQGAVTPDHYEVDKKNCSILSKSVHFQEKTMFRKNMRTIVQPLRKSKGARQKISDAHILALAKIGKKLEGHYYFPQDCEWAIEKNQLYIVQTRPVTTIGKREAESVKREKNSLTLSALNLTLILRGDPASPGLASGTVRWLSGPKEIHRINRGDVLVAEMTNPDYVPAMRKAVAIVTERGGRTSHAAIVSRELGIPAIVGAKNARRILKDDFVVTVNGSLGEVYKGSMLSPKIQSSVHTPFINNNIQTATKVYVNLAEPSRADAVAKLGADGVGLLRAEFMIADIGVHPRKFIADKRQDVFIHRLADSLETICSAFSPRPVIYRATDFRTNEYRNLRGGAQYEPPEDNPMLGFRGAARYVADSKVFDLELEAIKLIRNKKNLKNLSLMIPFVRTPKELLDVKKIVASNGLFRSPSFKLWMMVELPTNVISLEKFLDVGIDGVSIGSNDLTMLILGTDRDNSEVAHTFNEMDDSLLWAFERVIRICSKRKVTVSICGQAPSDYPELVDKLVSWGITSISVNPDVIHNVRMTVYEAEKKHILSKSK